MACVRFPCLPIEYYNELFFWRVGEKIGKPIKIDANTSDVSRGIEYKGIRLIFFECGKYGHKAIGYPARG
ncbi:conserved hypothetical protein [Ricinus communis]|uniref:DUF4283 domain-containing protein n=1 Tax=Ricinus communis TaxID=3988 RepID=B9T2X3_RICCO|nr:conserved hypothetical protein [Ricinus communis]